MQRASIVEELLVRVGEGDVLVVEADGVGADVDVNVVLSLVGEGLVQLVVVEGLEGDDLSIDEEGVLKRHRCGLAARGRKTFAACRRQSVRN